MLNTKLIDSFKPQDKAYKKTDGQGLFLFITPAGAKLWRMSYRFAKSQKELSIGPYPQITLKEAREKRDEVRRLLAHGTDPAAAKQQAKRAAAALRPFGEWADEWMEKQKNLQDALSQKTLVGKQRYVDYLKDEFGAAALADIKRSDVVMYLREYESEGALESRDRVRSVGEKIFDYSDLDGGGVNPFRNLQAQLTKNNSTPRPAFVKEKDARQLFRKMAEPYGSARYSDIIGHALRFLSLTVVRPGEIATCEWSDIDLDGARWTIPAKKMKMDREHIVPLSKQAVAILKQVKALTGHRHFVFSIRRDGRMPHTTLNRRLRDLGINTETEHCSHGFRSTFSTLLNAELDADENRRWDSDLIELQLAHLDSSSVKAIYDRTGAESLYAPRARLMQAWADKIDGWLGDNVVRLDQRGVA
jgi:integrase